MTDLNIILSDCTKHAECLFDIQLFLNSGSCPKEIESTLYEHSLDLLERMKTQLYFANQLPTADERIVVEKRLMDLIN